MTDEWIVGLSAVAGMLWRTRWMAGFELKGKQRMLSYTQIIEKGISDFFTGLFYSYVPDTQSSNHPIIQSSMGR
jgi:hypothetical protein